MTDTYKLLNRPNYNPEVWGKHGWFFLDSIILSYPDNPTKEQKDDYINFFNLIGSMFPCLKCRINYMNHLTSNPLTDDILTNRNKMIEWWLTIHNLVRASNNKNIIKNENFYKYYTTIYKINDDLEMIKNIIYICIFVYVIKWLSNNKIIKIF